MALWAYFGERRGGMRSSRRGCNGRSVGDSSSDVLEDVQEVCEGIDLSESPTVSVDSSPGSVPNAKCGPWRIPIASNNHRSNSLLVGESTESLAAASDTRYGSAPVNSPRRDLRFIDKTLIDLKSHHFAGDFNKGVSNSAEDIWLPRIHNHPRKVFLVIFLFLLGCCVCGRLSLSSGFDFRKA